MVYHPHWVIEKNVQLSVAFKRPNQLPPLKCTANIHIENIKLDIDLIIEMNLDGDIDRYLDYSLGDKDNTISVEDATSYTFKIGLGNRIAILLNNNPVIIGNLGLYKAGKTQQVGNNKWNSTK